MPRQCLVRRLLAAVVRPCLRMRRAARCRAGSVCHRL